jgi:hypothetical protein
LTDHNANSFQSNLLIAELEADRLEAELEFDWLKELHGGALCDEDEDNDQDSAQLDRLQPLLFQPVYEGARLTLLEVGPTTDFQSSELMLLVLCC